MSEKINYLNDVLQNQLKFLIFAQEHKFKKELFSFHMKEEISNELLDGLRE